jgi:hypothetical protein
MKTWITIPVDELTNLDYSKLAITNADSAPRNVAGDTALIKWYGDMPSEVNAISNRGTPLSHTDAIALMRSTQWSEEL